MVMAIILMSSQVPTKVKRQKIDQKYTYTITIFLNAHGNHDYMIHTLYIPTSHSIV